MSDLVPGIYYVFYLYQGGQWRGYMCARTMDIPVETGTIETTVTGSGNWRTFEPTAHSYGINIQGVISLDSSINLTFPQLRSLQFAKTPLLWRSVMTSQQNHTYVEEGTVFIINSIPTQSFDGVATFSISFQGSSKIVQVNTPPTPITQGDMRYPTQGNTAPYISGSSSWGLPGLTPSNTNLTNVVKDGRGSNNIILSGTPIGNEVLFEENPDSAGDGLLTWAVPFEEVETPPYIQYTQL